MYVNIIFINNITYWINALHWVPKYQRKKCEPSTESCDHLTSISALSSDRIFGIRNETLFTQQGCLGGSHINSIGNIIYKTNIYIQIYMLMNGDHLELYSIVLISLYSFARDSHSGTPLPPLK